VVDGFAQFLIVTGGNREGEETFMLALNALGKSSLGVAPDLLAVQSPLAANLAWFQSGLSRSQAALETATRAPLGPIGARMRSAAPTGFPSWAGRCRCRAVMTNLKRR
jgi:hypothetical protein